MVNHIEDDERALRFDRSVERRNVRPGRSVWPSIHCEEGSLTRRARHRVNPSWASRLSAFDFRPARFRTFNSSAMNLCYFIISVILIFVIIRPLYAVCHNRRTCYRRMTKLPLNISKSRPPRCWRKFNSSVKQLKNFSAAPLPRRRGCFVNPLPGYRVSI